MMLAGKVGVCDRRQRGGGRGDCPRLGPRRVPRGLHLSRRRRSGPRRSAAELTAVGAEVRAWPLDVLDAQASPRLAQTIEAGVRAGRHPGQQRRLRPGPAVCDDRGGRLGPDDGRERQGDVPGHQGVRPRHDPPQAREHRQHRLAGRRADAGSAGALCHGEERGRGLHAFPGPRVGPLQRPRQCGRARHADRRRERQRARKAAGGVQALLCPVARRARRRKWPSWWPFWPATAPATSTARRSWSTGASDEVPHGRPHPGLGAAPRDPRRQGRVVRGVRTPRAAGRRAVPAGKPDHGSLFQLGNWLVILSSDYAQMGLVVQWDEVRFLGTASAGTPAAHGGRRSAGGATTAFCSTARRRTAEQTIVTGRRCLAVPVPLADYYDPDDLRVLFSEIHRPNDPQSQEADHAPLERARRDLLHHGPRHVPPLPHGGAVAGVLPRRAGLAAEPLPVRAAGAGTDRGRQPVVSVRSGPRDARPLAAGRRQAAAARLSARLRPLHLARLAVPAARALDHQRLQPALPDLLHLQPRRPHLAHAGRGDAAHGGLDRRRRRAEST